MTQQQAQGTVLNNVHKHVRNNSKAMEPRWVGAQKIAMQYLSEEDQVDFAKSTESLISSLLRYGILGQNYNSKDDGIMDFIESTHYWSGQGLTEQFYTIVPTGATITNLIDGLKDVLVNGNYTPL